MVHVKCCSNFDWRKYINKRRIFGIVMLLIVDLIWVGSAGLTRYLFNTDYDKPLFTVYFKTALFIIYLLPFVFWRPWQRLCCTGCPSTKPGTSHDQPSTTTNQRTNSGDGDGDNSDGHGDNGDSDNGDGDDDVFIVDDIQSKAKQPDIISSHDSVAISGSFKFPMLGPSLFTQLNTDAEDGEVTMSLPQQGQKQRASIMTLSNNLNHRRSRVRFSRTVEVKHFPSISDNDSPSGSTNSKPVELLPVVYVIIIAIPFGLLWFFANYLYARALENNNVAIVNTLSSLSGAFVLVLSAIPLPRVSLRDKFSLTKLIIIFISVGGGVLVGLSINNGTFKVDYGALYAVGGAFLYACYLVLLSKAVTEPDSLEIPMFFGFVGLSMAILLVPAIVFWDYMQWEEFHLPNDNMVWTLLLINGFIGTVLSELLWLMGCLLTSSLVGTLSLSLVTPLSITYSIVVGESSISVYFVCGAVLTMLAFLMVAVVDYFNGWDPVWSLIKHSYTFVKDYKLHFYLNDIGVQSIESQCLLDNNNTQQ